MIHGVHHDHPNDPRGSCCRRRSRCPLALVFLPLRLGASARRRSGPFAAGFFAGYLVYDMLHFALHHHAAEEPPRPAPARAAHAPPLRGRRARLRRQRSVVGHRLRHPASRAARSRVAETRPEGLVAAPHPDPDRERRRGPRPACAHARGPAPAESSEVEVVTEDALLSMGRIVQWISEDSATIVFYRFQCALGSSASGSSRATRVTRARDAVAADAARRAGAAAPDRAVRPDVIVSVYPNVTEVLGRLRRAGRLDVPVCAGITDLAAMHYWASPASTCTSSRIRSRIAEVRARRRCRDAVVHCVHGFTRAGVPRPAGAGRGARRARAARRRAGSSSSRAAAGAWATSRARSTRRSRSTASRRSSVSAGATRSCARASRRRFAGEPRVRVEGFTEVMAEWMAAADVLVHSTGGLTVLESLMRGSRPISYGWGRGHIRVNNRAFRRVRARPRRVDAGRPGFRTALDALRAEAHRSALRCAPLGRLVRAGARRHRRLNVPLSG